MLLTSCTTYTYPAPNSSPVEQEPTLQDPITPDDNETNYDTSWIVETPRAIELIAEPESVVWDARGGAAEIALEGAQAVSWQEFSREDAPYKGLLLADLEALATRIEDRGVTSSRRVIVLDDPLKGWGEGGRLVWMLRTLGHQDAHLVMTPSAVTARIEQAVTERKLVEPDAGERFEVVPNDEVMATAQEIQSVLDAPDSVFIDTRELREYQGETPYGESRGGHLPGAVHLYFKDLLDEQGALLPKAELLASLATQGITPQKRIVAYCTGGIRSAWLVVVLKDLGFERVENYAGSMWEWSAQDAETHPLEK